jgi:hypothetical protein
MAQYDPIKVKQLIELCCWLNKVEPNAKGFEALVDSIDNAKHEKAIITTKYLQNLWGEISNAIKEERPLAKNDDYLIELANHCDYSNWDDYLVEWDKINGFLSPVADVSDFKEIKAVVLTDVKGEDSLRSKFSFFRKIIQFTPQLVLTEPNQSISLDKLIEENAYLVSFFTPNDVSSPVNAVDKEKLLDLKGTNRFVPVWSGNPRSHYNIENVQNDEKVVGDRGLFLTLLVINYLKDDKTADASGASSKKSGQSNTIRDNYGLIAGGDVKIEKGHVINGGTINLDYTKSKD